MWAKLSGKPVNVGATWCNGHCKCGSAHASPTAPSCPQRCRAWSPSLCLPGRVYEIACQAGLIAASASLAPAETSLGSASDAAGPTTPEQQTASHRLFTRHAHSHVRVKQPFPKHTTLLHKGHQLPWTAHSCSAVHFHIHATTAVRNATVYSLPKVHHRAWHGTWPQNAS